MATISVMTDAEVTAVAYTEAADGDARRASLWTVEGLIVLETLLAEATRVVSQGYIRAGTMGGA